MALTISVTLDDDFVEDFVRLFNEDAPSPITTDMVYQNEALRTAIAEDMAGCWSTDLFGTDDTFNEEDVEVLSVYDLYGEFFQS